MSKKRKTPKQIVDDANRLARLFYKAHGYQVPVDYRFDQAGHPQELGMWNLACIAFGFISNIDVQDALREGSDENA